MEALRGYRRELRTHSAVAEAVQQGKADVGLGLQAAARQHDLDFIPLFEERFDLALPAELLGERRMRQLLDFLSSASFRQLLAGLEGYSPAHSGDQLSP